MSWRSSSRLAVLTAAALAACSSISVSTDYDSAVDFTRYRTFAVRLDEGMRNRLQRERFERAAATQLAARGLAPARGTADLLVFVHVRLDRETQVDTTRFGYGWGRWGYWHRGVAVTTVRQVPVGTVVVDLVDAARKELVWQAVASDTVDPRATPEERDRHVDAVMKKVFAAYPPA